MISLLISWWIQLAKSTKRSSTGQMVRAEPSSMELKSYLSWSPCLFSWLMMAKDFVLFFDLSLTPSCLPGRSSLWALTLCRHTCGDCHHLLLTCRSSLWLFNGVAQSSHCWNVERVRALSSLLENFLCVFSLLDLIMLSVYRFPRNWWWTLPCDLWVWQREWKLGWKMLKRSECDQKRSGGDCAEEASVCVDSLPSYPWTPAPLSLYIYSAVVSRFVNKLSPFACQNFVCTRVHRLATTLPS